ncbi:IS5 family transposase [Streptomyces sp. NPDC024089]|uniref:IS5 family transposase n=1 Tax=Streptomyces sp. NPDC024089 TaxID=3154328 RepID=UPI0033FB1A2A
MFMGRGDLTNEEWARLRPHLPRSGQRGGRWVGHRRVINGILFRIRTGVPWRDLPARFGSWKTVYERHRRVCGRYLGPDLPGRPGGCRRRGTHRLEHGQRGLHVLPGSPACRWSAQAPSADAGKRRAPRQHRPDEGLGRSRGGLTCKIHLVGEGGRRPLTLLITPGQWGDAPQLIPVVERIRVGRLGGGRPRTRPDHLGGDKAYSSRRNRRYLRRRQIKHTIPEPSNQRVNRQSRGSQGGRPVGFDKEIYKRRNEVERTINALKGFRAVATRYDKRAYVFHGAVTATAIRLWLRPCPPRVVRRPTVRPRIRPAAAAPPCNRG